ncbi:hypothetical protein [Streptosporangium sp. NPDC002607]
MREQSSPMSPGGDPAERGVTEMLLGALAGSALLPFLQAVATKAGEDLYTRIRDLLSGESRERARTSIAEAGHVTLADQGSKTIVRLPADLPADAAAALRALRLPPAEPGWRVVYWDGAHRVWVCHEVDAPPRGALRVDEITGDTPPEPEPPAQPR